MERLLAEVPPALFEEWREFYELSPWGEDRAELRHGRLCSLLSSIHADRVQAAPPSRFMAYQPDSVAQPRQSQAQMRATVETINSQRLKIEKMKPKSRKEQ